MSCNDVTVSAGLQVGREQRFARATRTRELRFAVRAVLADALVAKILAENTAKQAAALCNDMGIPTVLPKVQT